MANFSVLIKFESEEDRETYFADLGPDAQGPPTVGTKVSAVKSLHDLTDNHETRTVTIRRLTSTSVPPLWTKPAASLANPGEDIPINDFCAKSLPDYEGELVFVTSKQCRDISPKEAKDYILGYTVGNDVSCRMYQLPKHSAGQFFFAKAFDKFAPIGPALISPAIFGDGSGFSVEAKVNGKVRQVAEFKKDMVFSPEQILSHMSQGTTVPAGTAVMTGTPAGVGAFHSPKVFLKDGDVLEVTMARVGTLRNVIKFQ
ncbi:Fumarylacetoacetate hydrolase domain-containing protein 2 [Fusarium oxysporum f. sp. raphani]|uniref:Fumarylacetoacetate hydrolase domain-containing protein 2 n=1 Tax=Fusarium oxysporum f. sp. raphani TaxID=96318 RepID=A0A8J5PUU7_FUSOX|nr:Fumarylacetoacetate hydrolase domain-containing protein 2 [Fusarium oxysporum f. sp. raphani]